MAVYQKEIQESCSYSVHEAECFIWSLEYLGTMNEYKRKKVAAAEYMSLLGRMRVHKQKAKIAFSLILYIPQGVARSCDGTSKLT